MPPPPVIETPRLRLREFCADDRSALVRMHGDARVRSHLLDDWPLDQPLVAQTFIERLQAIYRGARGLGVWHAERRVEADAALLAAAHAAGDLSDAALALLGPRWSFCGWFNLMAIPGRADRVEIGCRLVPAAWGQGLALEGGEALLEHGFVRLGLREVWGLCDPRHRSVQLCLRTLGFRPLGPTRYDGRRALQHWIDAPGWRAAAALPRRQRARAALRELNVNNAVAA
jgi:RimJ/RimL family protein N-acetyltransferase